MEKSGEKNINFIPQSQSTDEVAQTVWEMTYRITEPAGGAQKNRRDEGTIPLKLGGISSILEATADTVSKAGTTTLPQTYITGGWRMGAGRDEFERFQCRPYSALPAIFPFISDLFLRCACVQSRFILANRWECEAVRGVLQKVSSALPDFLLFLPVSR
jgi:hypothetical protein